MRPFKLKYPQKTLGNGNYFFDRVKYYWRRPLFYINIEHFFVNLIFIYTMISTFMN